MKLRRVSPAEALDLVKELRAMAELPPGPNPQALERAREIRFQLCGQAWAREHFVEKADAVYRELEILFSHRRWKDLARDLDGFRKTIKSACDRLRAYVHGRIRAGRLITACSRQGGRRSRQLE